MVNFKTSLQQDGRSSVISKRHHRYLRQTHQATKWEQQERLSFPRQRYSNRYAGRTSNKATGKYQNPRISPHAHQTNVKNIQCISTVASFFPCSIKSPFNAINDHKTSSRYAQTKRYTPHNIYHPQPPNSASLMAKRKINTPTPNPKQMTPISHPISASSQNTTHHPHPNPTVTYSQAGNANAFVNPAFSHRFQSPPWPHFLDHNPFQINNSPHSHALPTTSALPLPPNPSKLVWRGRCYNCLILGHDQKSCMSKERVCANCWQKGHEAKNCKLGSFNPLTPRGNLGESALPTNRPNFAVVFTPETQKVKQNMAELHRAILIDARLHQNHTTNIIQSILMSTCQSDYPYPLTHMNGFQYLLLLPPGSYRNRFLQKFAKPLEELGYITYP